MTLSSENIHTRKQMYKSWKKLGLMKTFDTGEKDLALLKAPDSVAFKALIIT